MNWRAEQRQAWREALPGSTGSFACVGFRGSWEMGGCMYLKKHSESHYHTAACVFHPTGSRRGCGVAVVWP